ncbi:acetate--CoA ligase [Azonexus sp. IMCC34839]|uniref:acetate--CoA ligase n=1 Tax=Azonexus sp. IMCC34839 TaxID=3133695 RepID=UPI003999D5AB
MKPTHIRNADGEGHAPVGAAAEAFAWESVARELNLEPRGPFNMAWLAVDRHAASERADKPAFRFLAEDGGRSEITYRELARQTDRFGNALKALGVRKGDCVFVLCGRRCELYVAVLGALKVGAVVSPLFPAFGPEPVRNRVAQACGKVLVTTRSAYRRKIEPIRGELPSLRHVVLIDDLGGELPSETLDWPSLFAGASDESALVPTTADDPALLHFTSGTTGAPKGALHVHGAALMHYATARRALDLRPDDAFWCTADPGWVTGMSYGIFAPLIVGVTSIVEEAEFDAARWLAILEKEGVNVWYTAPTAIRMLIKAGPALFAGHAFPALRFIASVGEPLNAEAVAWGEETFGQTIHDTWWQTETGGIMIANVAGCAVKPGSMGRPLPGVVAQVVRHRAGEPVQEITEPDVVGELALETGWPSMFRAYLGQPERYRDCFAGELYLSGDLVRRDADGYFWFVGRSDDVIKSAGHLVGPFEVERVLMEHPAVAEAGVIGKPDALAGETIKAFVTLKQGAEASEALRSELLAHARRRLGPAVAPKEIAFAECLPHTRSGKIMRRLLKARELGLPEGDSSTLE